MRHIIKPSQKSRMAKTTLGIAIIGALLWLISYTSHSKPILMAAIACEIVSIIITLGLLFDGASIGLPNRKSKNTPLS